MLSKNPQVAELGHGIGRNLRHLVGVGQALVLFFGRPHIQTPLGQGIDIPLVGQ